MKVEATTKKELIKELQQPHRQTAKLGKSKLERKQAEETLKNSEAKFKELFNTMTSGVAVYEAIDNGEDFVFKDFNHAAEIIENVRGGDVLGKRISEAFPGVEEFGLLKVLQRVWRTGKAEYFPEMFYQDERHRGWRENWIYKLPRGEIVAVYNDITERKQLETEKKELEREAQLSSQLATVGAMASGIAHEINNPLTSVIGFSQLLMTRDIPEDIKSDIAIINDGAQRVASIVKGLLSFAHQHQPERSYTDINEIIETTLALRAYELKTNSINVIKQLASDLPLTMADSNQLQQVFLNLIINAETEMKLTSDKHKLTVKTEIAGNTIRISFKDNGPGISSENLEKIFNPFFTTKEVGKGTGLGLSICHGIISEHNGRIYAESDRGKGATFTVELPIVSEESQPALSEPEAEEPEKVSGAKILVVDDEMGVLQYLSHLLSKEGYQIETVDNASDALEMIRRETYNLILTDIKMPDMSGIEFYQRMQKLTQSLAGRVVFIAGNVTEEDVQSFSNKHKVPCISKPFATKKLLKTIARLLAERTQSFDRNTG